MRRTKLSFAYIYWSNVYVRNMIYDLDTGHAYNAYAATASMNPRTDYPDAWATSTMCTLHGMNITEVTSLTESLEQMRTQRFGEMYLGGRRISGSVLFKWAASNLTFPYQMWRPLRPMASTTSRDCVKQSAQFDWEDVLCNESVPSIACRSRLVDARWVCFVRLPAYIMGPDEGAPHQRDEPPAVSNSTEDANWFEDGPEALRSDSADCIVPVRWSRGHSERRPIERPHLRRCHRLDHQWQLHLVHERSHTEICDILQERDGPCALQHYVAAHEQDPDHVCCVVLDGLERASPCDGR